MSIIRPEKRDPNHIRNKSDIGLSKVDNVSSAEFASIVLDQVKRHLNRETIYQTSGRRFIALAKITGKSDGSGNITKILSGNLFLTFAILNESEDVREAAKLEAIYTHATSGTESDSSDDKAKVEYNLFMTEEPTALNECYLEFRENVFENAEGVKVNEMYVILRCDASNLPFVSVNLFEYSNGGVALDPTVIDENVLASYTLISSAKCDHNRFSLVDRSESTVGFEIYDKNGNPIRVKETDSSINSKSDFDIPTINNVPFTGRRNISVGEFNNTRQITVTARHSGPNKDDAGEHSWEVLTYAPRSGYTYWQNEAGVREELEGEEDIDGSGYIGDNSTLSNNKVYPQVESFLDKDNFEIVDNGNSIGYGYGLCRLSGYDYKLIHNTCQKDTDLSNKLAFIKDWVNDLSSTDSDVISVGAFKIFAKSILNLFNDSIGKLGLFRSIMENDCQSLVKPENLELLKTIPSNTEELGFHYIFDYASTGDCITRVPHTGRKNVSYTIKLGVMGEDKNGTGLIDVDETGSFIKGGNCDWVNVVSVERRPNEWAKITFSFLPNTTNEERYGYYIIPSNQPGIKLIYRFYQDVIVSRYRIECSDSTSTEYYPYETKISKIVKNTEGSYIFDNICVVDYEELDEQNRPVRVNKMLQPDFSNIYENGKYPIKIEEIRNEHSQIFGYKVSFSNNDSNKDREVEIYFREVGSSSTKNIFTIKITQTAREFEFIAPDSVTVEGRKGDTVQIPIETNRNWVLSIIRGADLIKLDTMTGSIPEGGLEGNELKKFNVTLTANSGNTGSSAKEIAILKLHAEGDETKYKRIFVYQNNEAPICDLQGRTVNLPYKIDDIKVEKFNCNYKWEIVLSEEMKRWCSVTPEKEDTDPGENKEYSVTFKALETTELTTPREGVAQIRYADGAAISEFIVRQEAARFDFTFTGLIDNNRVNLGSEIESAEPAEIKVTSNYEWSIGIKHENDSNKRFTACVNKVEGNLMGNSGSSIYVSATKNSSSDSESIKLGKITVYALGSVVKEFDVYQDKIGVSIKLSPGSQAGWYPNGNSKQSGTDVTIPITFTPESATVTATYSVDGDTPVAATITKGSAGQATITIPGIGSNPKGKETRTVVVNAKSDVSGVYSTDSCSITQSGFSNGIRVTKDGSSNEYYGGTRSTESTIYFDPTIQTKSFNSLYVPIGAKSLVVTKPNWLSISEGTDTSSSDYLLKIRDTISINNTASNRTGTIKIVSGSGNDITEATIPVVQYSGSWVFGESGKDYSKTYTLENPYELSIGAAAESDVSLTFISSLSYGNKTELSQYTVSMLEGNDWCSVGSSTDTSINQGKITFKTTTTNSTTNTKTAVAKVTQTDTNKTFYIRVTQSISTKVHVYGGVEGVKYVLVDSNLSEILLNSTQAQVVMNKATVFVGAGGTSLINTYVLNNISYVKYSSGGVSVDTVGNIEDDNTVLYVASVRYNDSGNTVIALRDIYTLSNDYIRRALIVPKKRNTTVTTIQIQGFGSDRIKLSDWHDLGMQILEKGYEFILTNSPHSIYWDTTSPGIRLSNNFWFYISERDLDINGNIDLSSYYFTVDPSHGVEFFTDASSTSLSTCKDQITLYVYRRPHKDVYNPSDPGNQVWSGCGTVTWHPMQTNPVVLWYY